MDLVGKRLSKYLVAEEIGRGAQATIYRALLSGTRKEVAIKVLHEELGQDDELIKRFHREGTISASLNHPNVLRVYEVSDPTDSLHYLVTDLVVGINLEQFLQANKVHCPEIAQILMLPVLKGLQALHEKGIVHRDIKPANIMVDWVRKRLTITDLGLAQPIGASRYSRFGTLVGSLAFMAPERLRDKKWDHRVDLWAFGTILYWICTFQFPFEAKNEDELVKRILSGRFERPSALNPMISEHLESVIMRCLEADLGKRYDDAREIRRDLELELRANGVEDAEEELYNYLINPRSNGKLLHREIATGIKITGRAMLASGPRDAALRYWERVKAYCPDDPAVIGLDLSQLDEVELPPVAAPQTGEFRPGDFEFMANKRPKAELPAPGWRWLVVGAVLVIATLVLLWKIVF